MVIDLILDTMEEMKETGQIIKWSSDGGRHVDYSPEIIYREIQEYNDYGCLNDLLRAFDCGTNADIAKEFMKYIEAGGYCLPDEVIKWINTFDWLQNYEG